MVLADIRDYLRVRGRASVTDLCHRFGTDADALEGMIAIWERKGRVRRIEGGARCSTCCSCAAANVDVYEWVEKR